MMERCLQLDADVGLLSQAVLLAVAGEDQGQRAVAGDVAGGAEGVLNGEDGQKQSGAFRAEAQHAGDDAQRCHDGAAGDAGGANGEDTQQHAEQDHGANAGKGAVQNQGDDHHEEGLGQYGAAQVDVGEQGHAEVNHVLTQDAGLVSALQGHGQGGGGGHGAHGGDVGGAVVLHNLDGAALGVGTGGGVQDSQPDDVAHQNHDHSHQEDGQLLGDGALIGQASEGAGDEEGQNGNNDLGYQIQHDLLELVQNHGDGLGLGPHGSQTDEDGEHQRGHDGHDLGDGQTEDVSGQLLQLGGLLGGVHHGNENITGNHGQQGGQNGGSVGKDQRHTQKLRGVVAQLGDGGGDEADDDQGNDEADDLAHDILDGNQNHHDGFGDDQANDDADHDADEQLGGKAGKQFFHSVFLLTFLLSSFFPGYSPTIILMISSLVPFMPSLPRRPMLAMVSSGVSPTRPSSGWKF